MRKPKNAVPYDGKRITAVNIYQSRAERLSFLFTDYIVIPRKDTYHDQFRRALEKDGWTVTHDPFFLKIETKGVYIDLAAEKTLSGSTDETVKIALEIKNFISLSEMNELEKALGQYSLYDAALHIAAVERELFLAIPDFFYEEITASTLYSVTVKNLNVKLVVFNVEDEIITQWKK